MTWLPAELTFVAGLIIGLAVSRQIADKLDALRGAARTALCVGSDASNLDLYLTHPGTSPTLRELAEFLRAEGCLHALNLDGGPSTAAVAREPAGVFKLGSGWRSPMGWR